MGKIIEWKLLNELTDAAIDASLGRKGSTEALLEIIAKVRLGHPDIDAARKVMTSILNREYDRHSAFARASYANDAQRNPGLKMSALLAEERALAIAQAIDAVNNAEYEAQELQRSLPAVSGRQAGPAPLRPGVVCLPGPGFPAPPPVAAPASATPSASPPSKRFVVEFLADLTPAERAFWAYNDGFVSVVRDTETREILGGDGGAPENQTLVRDWAWVVDALNRLVRTREKSV